MTIRILALALAVAAFTAPASAQIGNPAGMGADTRMAEPGVPAPHQTNNHDRLVAQLLAAGGKAEVALAEMAQEKSDTDSVRQFAEMMIADHGDANARLTELAEAARIPLPEALPPDQQAVLDRLSGLSDADFDRAYINAQITDHQKTVNLLGSEISSGQDLELQRFAADVLPVVLGHLDRAQMIKAELTGATPRLTTADHASSGHGTNP